MNSLETKRSSICGVDIQLAADAGIINVFGLETIKVGYSWFKLKPSVVEFNEQKQDDGHFYNVSLAITFTDTSYRLRIELNKFLQTEVVVRISYSDGTVKIVGTDTCPLVFIPVYTGNPSVFRMSYNGSQPELSKFVSPLL